MIGQDTGMDKGEKTDSDEKENTGIDRPIFRYFSC